MAEGGCAKRQSKRESKFSSISQESLSHFYSNFKQSSTRGFVRPRKAKSRALCNGYLLCGSVALHGVARIRRKHKGTEEEAVEDDDEDAPRQELSQYCVHHPVLHS